MHFEVYCHQFTYSLEGTPPESLGLANCSGWMNSELFPVVLRYFIKFMNVSITDPEVLFLDNHVSHLSLEAIELARENGLHLLKFPPHCSHKLLPLDVSAFGPFKRNYSALCDARLTSNPNKLIFVYDVAKISGKVYARAFNIPNITSGFKATGIWPFNPIVFSDDEFLPASVTDVSLPVETENDTPSTSSNPLTTPEDIDI